MPERKSDMEIAAEITIAAIQKEKFPSGDPSVVADYLEAIYVQVTKLQSATFEKLRVKSLD